MNSWPGFGAGWPHWRVTFTYDIPPADEETLRKLAAALPAGAAGPSANPDHLAVSMTVKAPSAVASLTFATTEIGAASHAAGLGPLLMLTDELALEVLRKPDDGRPEVTKR